MNDEHTPTENGTSSNSLRTLHLSMHDERQQLSLISVHEPEHVYFSHSPTHTELRTLSVWKPRRPPHVVPRPRGWSFCSERCDDGKPRWNMIYKDRKSTRCVRVWKESCATSPIIGEKVPSYVPHTPNTVTLRATRTCARVGGLRGAGFVPSRLQLEGRFSKSMLQ